jgi:hypothetical protein
VILLLVVLFAFILGAAFGVFLDRTQRNKPIDIGLGKVLVGNNANDPTEFFLVQPYKPTSGNLGESIWWGRPAKDLGIILVRIRVADADGAWVFREAFERAVEAAALEEDGGVA